MSMKKIMLMTAIMAAAAQSEMFPEKAPRKEMSFNPDYKPPFIKGERYEIKRRRQSSYQKNR